MLVVKYSMHIFGLILFAGMVVSSTIRQKSVTQPTVFGFLAPELRSSTGLKSTTIPKTPTLSNKNDDQDCICTPYHMCKSFNAALVGDRPTHKRTNAAPCQSYLDVCCNDTKITSTEKYKSTSSDDCECIGAEDYREDEEFLLTEITFELFNIKKVTKKPSVGRKDESYKNTFDGQLGGYTKEPCVC